MLQLVSTLDENGQVVAKGTKVQRGYYADNGPPTTVSGNGRDLSLSYQGFIVRDDVRFVNGNQLGSRMSFQVRMLRSCHRLGSCIIGEGGDSDVFSTARR